MGSYGTKEVEPKLEPAVKRLQRRFTTVQVLQRFSGFPRFRREVNNFEPFLNRLLNRRWTGHSDSPYSIVDECSRRKKHKRDQYHRHCRCREISPSCECHPCRKCPPFSLSAMWHLSVPNLAAGGSQEQLGTDTIVAHRNLALLWISSWRLKAIFLSSQSK